MAHHSLIGNKDWVEDIILPNPNIQQFFNIKGQLVLSVHFIAELLAELIYPTYRFNPDSSVWYHFNGVVWEQTKSIYNPILEALKEIRHSFRKKLSTVDKDNIERMFTGFDAMLGNDFVYKVIHNLESHSKLYVSDADFDTNPYILNTPGGVIDLTTGEISPNKAEYLCRHITAVSPLDDRDGAMCPHYMSQLKFMGNDVPETMEYLEKISGYILSGETALHQFYWMYGEQKNGKSTLVNVWGHILGGRADTSYFWVAESDLFAKTHNKPHLQALLRLAGKRLVFTEELDGGEWNAAMIKGIISGSPIAAREMRGSTINFLPMCKLIFTSNHRPAAGPNDGGMVRRMHLLDFVNQISDDKKIIDFERRFIRPEASYILNRMIKAAIVVLSEKSLNLPEVFKDATAEYFGDADYLKQFIEDCCETGDSLSEAFNVIHKAYKAWCVENEFDNMSPRKFGDLLRDKGYKSIKLNNIRCRKKIQLNVVWRAKLGRIGDYSRDD